MRPKPPQHVSRTNFASCTIANCSLDKCSDMFVTKVYWKHPYSGLSSKTNNHKGSLSACAMIALYLPPTNVKLKVQIRHFFCDNPRYTTDDHSRHTVHQPPTMSRRTQTQTAATSNIWFVCVYPLDATYRRPESHVRCEPRLYLHVTITTPYIMPDTSRRHIYSKSRRAMVFPHLDGVFALQQPLGVLLHPKLNLKKVSRFDEALQREIRRVKLWAAKRL